MGSISILGASLMAITIAILLVSDAKNIEPQEYPFTKNNRQFASNIYSVLAKDEKLSMKNFVISPFSIQVAGAMVYTGAAGKTAEELTNRLSLGANDKSEVGDIFKAALDGHATDPVEIANKIYLAEGLQVKPDFHQVLKEKFYSKEENVDFTKKEKAADKINSWVKEATHDKIQEFVNADSIEPDTLMFLLNAIYFKGFWKVPFTDTDSGDFWVNESEKKTVDQMGVLGSFRFGEIEELDADVLEMEYINTTGIAMMIILPKSRNGLKTVEEKLPSVNLFEVSRNLPSPWLVDVKLPKFTIEFKTDLKETLSKMGMETMFSDAADFSDIISAPKLKISKATHKAVIEVNELGTEAAAVTGFGIRPMTTYPEFIADHPFMFVIRCRYAYLFMGRYMG